MSSRWRALVLAVIQATAAASMARAQEPPRPPKSPIPDLVAGLSYISLSQEVTSANYTVDSDQPGVDDTTFWTVKIPWEQDIDVASPWGTLYVEAAFGWLQADDRLEADLGGEPLVVSQDWLSYGGLLGAGWTFTLPDGWRLRPSASVALSRIENDASYNDLAQQVLAPYLDGVYVNWEAWAATSLLSLALLQEFQMGPVSAHVRGRYTFAYSDVFAATDEFQRADDWSHFLAVRLDLDGPTPIQLDARTLDWGLFLGYAGFDDIEEGVLGFDQIYETGLSLSAPTLGGLPDLQLSGALVFGPDISGWSLGLGVSL